MVCHKLALCLINLENNHARLPLTTAHYPTYVLLPDDLFAKVADVYLCTFASW